MCPVIALRMASWHAATAKVGSSSASVPSPPCSPTGVGRATAWPSPTRAGRVVATYSYDPFGQPQAGTSATEVANPWRFANGYLDATGL